MSGKKLTDYFKAVERRFEKLGPEEGSAVQIMICGSVVEMRFLTKEHADNVKKYLYTPVIEKYTEPSAVLYYWLDDLYEYTPEGARNVTAVWTSKDDTGELMINPDLRMVGIDYARNVYYQCHKPFEGTDYTIHGHSMAPLLSRWALRNGAVMLHSACLGYNGKGVMLAGMGGDGKSTLTIACMLDGCDFVSDDYICVSQQGPLTAMPVYRLIGINQDMAAILKPDLPVLRTEPKRANKLFLDASACGIKDSLPVNAIIWPHKCDAKQPEIIKAQTGPVMIKIIKSTAANMQNYRDPETYRIIAQRLMKLPIYEFRLTTDLFRNRDYLKEFIINEL
ncbi:MAG: hypothetical protein IKG70_01145 [Lachnospiraceae bacterium]|nr:hypothetical protein [Lachnospiraceae bacterium]